MRINNNLMAINTHRQYNINNGNVAKSAEKLSSGYRINRAGDDAAGLAISEKMRGQIRGLNMASKNSQDAISLVQTTEGALTEVHAILQRMRELAVQSSNDTNAGPEEEHDPEILDTDVMAVDRLALDLEVQMLKEEITAIGKVTSFNGKKIFGEEDDSEYTNLIMQTGANGYVHPESGAEAIGDTYNRMAISINPLRIDTVGGYGFSDIPDDAATESDIADYIGESIEGEDLTELSVGSRLEAIDAIDMLDAAINKLSLQRGLLGAYQNRLEHKVANLDVSAENVQAAESRIRDVDMAKEMSTFTKQNILSQAATAMLAQANQAPQNVLQLLR